MPAKNAGIYGARIVIFRPGRRIKAHMWATRQGETSTNTEEYVYDKDGQLIGGLQPNGTFNRVEIYAGARHLATYNSATSMTYFIHDDWQGTERVRSTAAGASYETCVNFPYGDQQTCTGATDPSPLHYTGKMRDSETQLDYFGARYYSSAAGHWMSPDWASKPTAVPYANFGDPQTLNLYGMVTGNPVSKQDSDGHMMWLNQEKASWGDLSDGGGGSGLDAVEQEAYQQVMSRVYGSVGASDAEGLTGFQGGGAEYFTAAQQQYGRQADGSYKADPAKVQAAIDAGKPIHEPGNPDQKSECVFARKFLAQMKNIGTGQWRKGRAAAGLNDTTDIGLAIATLGSGTYPSQHGNSGIYMGHDANGGIKIVDQWPNNGPEYNHPFEHTLTRHDQGPAMDPSAYFVIMVPRP